MELEVRPCSSIDEVLEALVPIAHYFGFVPTKDDGDRWLRTVSVSRMHAARMGSTVVGGAGAFTFEMTVPGGATVAAAGVTVVGVSPIHRRRGVLRAMMRAQIDDIHRRGEPVAYLWASEETIYGRYGYGMASLQGQIAVPKSHTAFVRPVEARGQLRFVEETAELEPFATVYDAVRSRTPGMFGRTEDWWRVRRLADPEKRRGGGGVLNRVILTIGGEARAYALYRMNQSLEAGVTTGAVKVIEALGADLQATAEIWRFLFDIDWVSRIEAASLPLDHPLWFLLARPRLMSFQVGDGLWVRLVDVEAALHARSIADGPPIVMEVVDEFCPWNAGAYRIADGTVKRTKAAADLRFDVSSLGSIYLGGFTFGELARAGRVEEVTAHAAARADALFPRDGLPSCPEIF